MAGEWRIVVASCGLEKGARRQVLEVLAGRANEDTGWVTVSMATLAMDIGLSADHVRKVVAGLVKDADLDGLLVREKQGNGRGDLSEYRLHIDRLQPLAAAVQLARRTLRAGCAKAFENAGLVGAKLSHTSIVAAFEAIERALWAEGRTDELQAVRAQKTLYLARRSPASEAGACGKPGGKAGEITPFEGGEKGGAKEGTKGETNPVLFSEKGEKKPRKGENFAAGHYKELHPIPSPLAPARAGEALDLVKQGEPVPLAGLVLAAGAGAAASFPARLTEGARAQLTGDCLYIEPGGPWAHGKLAAEQGGLRQVGRAVGCSVVMLAAVGQCGAVSVRVGQVVA